MTSQNRTFTLPSDLGAQIGRDTLARLVCQITGAYAEELAPESSRDDSTAEGCNLLGLLTHCYASGALSSRAITELAETDPVVKAFCGDTIPERDDVARFRREHRALIQECLKQVYEAAWQAIVDEAEPGRVAGGRGEIEPRPSESLPCDPDELRRQIHARISQAAQMDCLSQDW